MSFSPGPLVVAQGFVAPRVWWRLTEAWGEAAWTAADLFAAALDRETRSASLRFAFGLPA